MKTFADILLFLWATETIASAVVGLRALDRFPFTSCCLLVRSALYLSMALDWWLSGPEHYRMGHISSAWIFRGLTVVMALESVWLMAQGIPQVRRFALVTSLLFAGMGILAAMATGGLLHGQWIDVALGNNVAAYRNLAVACMVYLLANHWLYERARPMGTLATQHWRGMIVLVACLMIGYGLEGHGRWATVAGQYVVRVGSLAALWIWGRNRKDL